MTSSSLDRLRLITLCALLVAMPLEVILVIPASFRIPPYVYLLPVFVVLALVTGGRGTLWRRLVSLGTGIPRRLAQALAIWVGLVTLSIGMWLIDGPPRVSLAAEYGSLRASDLRAPIQLAILLSFLAALPLVIALAKGRTNFAVGAFLFVATSVAAYGIYQVFANRFDLPFYNLSNDPLTAGRRVPSGGELGVRARSTFGEPAALGHYLLGGWAVAAGLFVWPPAKRVRFHAAASGAIITAAIVATSSVGAWLGMIAVALIFAVAIVHRRSWLGGAMLAVGTVAVSVAFVACLLVVIAPTGPAQRAAPPPLEAVGGAGGTLARRFADRFSEAMSEERREIVTYQLHLFEQRPVLGVGLGAADIYLAADVTPGSLPSSHGIWWASLSETGLVGTVALLAALLAFARIVVRAATGFPGSPLYGAAVGALAGVSGQLVSYLTFSERIAPHVWATMAIGVVAAASAPRGLRWYSTKDSRHAP